VGGLVIRGGGGGGVGVVVVVIVVVVVVAAVVIVVVVVVVIIHMHLIHPSLPFPPIFPIIYKGREEEQKEDGKKGSKACWPPSSPFLLPPPKYPSPLARRYSACWVIFVDRCLMTSSTWSSGNTWRQSDRPMRETFRREEEGGRG